MSDTRPIFEQYAEDYDAVLQQGLSVSGEQKTYFADGRIRWLHQRLQRHGWTAMEVLDFGCGIGDSAPLLKALDGVTRVTGTDVSSNVIEKARTLFPDKAFSFDVLDLQQTPRPAFDLVYCNGVFHHIPPAERESAVRWIQAALRPGGWFAFWENNPWNPGTRYVMSRIPFDRHASTLSCVEARRLLRSQGFDVVETRFLFIFPRPLRLLRFLEPLLSPLPLGAQYLVLARKPDRG